MARRKPNKRKVATQSARTAHTPRKVGKERKTHRMKPPTLETTSIAAAVKADPDGKPMLKYEDHKQVIHMSMQQLARLFGMSHAVSGEISVKHFGYHGEVHLHEDSSIFIELTDSGEFERKA